MKVEKNPFKGSEIVPEIMSLQAVGGLCFPLLVEDMPDCVPIE